MAIKQLIEYFERHTEMGNQDEEHQNGTNKDSSDVKNTLVRSFFQYLFRTSPWLIFFHSLMFILWGLTFLLIYDVYSYVNKGNSVIDYFETNLDIGHDHYLQYTALSKTSEDLLEEIRQELGAKEVSIYLLHNGKASLGGIPFLKVSQFAISKHLSNQIIRVIDEPINNVPQLQNTLRGEIVWVRIDDYPVGSVYRGLLQGNHSNDMIVRGPLFKTFDGIPHGWITIIYDENTPIDDGQKDRIEAAISKYTSLFQAISSIVDKPR